MGRFFYRLVLGMYRSAVNAAALFNPKAAKFIQGRKNIFNRLRDDFSDISDPVVWFHCASLGEFEQGRPVMETFKKEYPAYKIFLTFFSPSGYEVRKNYQNADFIYYLPLDSEKNADKLLEIVPVKMAVFVKYEFWYFYLRALNYRKIPVVLISAIFRPNQVFFKPYGKFYLNLLSFFNHIFVQNKLSYQLLKEKGIKHVSISGDTRFDRVKQICSESKRIPVAESFSKDSRVMVCGSTWPGDMQVLYPLINNNDIELKYIIAPHNIKDTEIKELELKINRKTIRFSKADDNNIKDYEVLIIDNIGMLSSLYRYGILAYIGGAFRKALHNILEAATYGMPVIFGADASNKKFSEAIELLEKGGAVAIHDSDELKGIVETYLTDTDKSEEAGRINASYVIDNTGATKEILSYIKNILSE